MKPNQNWTKVELSNMNHMKKLVRMYKAWHQRDDIDVIYVKRKGERDRERERDRDRDREKRRIANRGDSVDTAIEELEDYKKKE